MGKDNNRPWYSDSNDKPHRRRKFLKLTGAVVSVSGFAGCSSQSGNNSQSGSNNQSDGGSSNGSTGSAGSSGSWPDLNGKTVTIISEDVNENIRENYKQISKDFKKATGATVDVQYVARGEQQARALKLIQAGHPPTIVDALSGAKVTEFMQGGALAPVTSIIDHFEDEYGSPPPDSVRLKKDGDDMYLPLWTNNWHPWHRMDIFDKIPETQEELITQAQEHDHPRGVRGQYLATGKATCTDYALLSWAYPNGAKLCDRKNGKVQCIMNEKGNQQSWVQTFEFLQKLAKAAPNGSDSSCTTQSQVISNKTAASAVYAGTRLKHQSIVNDRPFAKNLHANLMPKGTDSRMGLGVAEGPALIKGGNEKAGRAYIKFATQLKYLKPFIASPDGAALMNTPLLDGIVESDMYQKFLSNISPAWSKKDIQTWLSTRNHIKSFPGETNPPNPYTGNILSSNILSDLKYDVVNQGMNPGKAVKTYSSKINSVIEDARE